MNEEQIEIVFHDVEYIATVMATDDKLAITVEEKYTGEIWKNEIPAKYLEDITQKTGNYKKYAVFVRLLINALKKEDKTSYIDLLTYENLELLKNKKGEEKKDVPKKLLNKRYLILTVCCENDRVHYPIPLNYEEVPDSITMRKTLQRLKAELELARKSNYSSAQSVKANSFYSNESSQLEEENEKLKKKVALFELTRPGAVDLDSMSKSLQEKAKDIEKIRKESEREMTELRMRLTEREKELEDTRSELSKTKTEWNNTQTVEEYDTLRKTLTDVSVELENEKNVSKSIIEKQQKDIDVYQKELRTTKENERKANVKIKQLENELDMSIKKLNMAVYGTTRSRGNSNSSQKSSGYGKVSPAPKHNSTSKRTSSLPSSQKKPTYSTAKKPPAKITPKSRYSPAAPNTNNRRSPYNARPKSKNKSSTPTQVNNRKPSPAGPIINKNRPITLKNQRVSPGPTKKPTSVYDRLYGKQPVQLTNAAKDVAKHEQKKEPVVNVMNVVKEPSVIQPPMKMVDESMPLIRRQIEEVKC